MATNTSRWLVLAAFLVAGPAWGCGSSDTTGVQDGKVGTDLFVEAGSGPDVVQVDQVSKDVAPEPDTGAVDAALDAAVEVLEDVGQACEPGDGCFLEPCDEADDCLSGICTLHLGDKICSKTCDAACPQGFSCTLVVTGGSDGAYVCTSNHSHLCQPCHELSDCSSDGAVQNACMILEGEGTFCGGSCESDVECPEQYVCQEVPTRGGGFSAQCVPISGACDCSVTSVDLSLSTPCEIENEFGTCSGLRICQEAGLAGCDATEPQLESCNGLDDDCDGAVDETTCDDGNPCTADSCEGEGGCKHTSLGGSNCDDASACTTDDVCVEMSCNGTILECDDGDVCTDDACESNSGCVYEHNAAPCDDDDPCTLVDACAGGICQAGATIACDDNNACTVDSCTDEGCTFAAIEGGCDDGNACTALDSCADGSCQPGPSADCDDGNLCTVDTCDVALGCQTSNSDGPCDDSNACTNGDHCAGGSCQPGSDLSCDDGNTCTNDGCDAEAGCTFESNEDGCDDGNSCTEGDTCEGGACFGGTVVDCSDGNGCTVDSCDLALGCQNAASDASCDDADLCTTGDSCADGGCQGGAVLTCDDGNVCTDDTCDPAAGCVFSANAAGCSDANDCTQDDGCVDGGCQAGTLVDCDDANPCTADTCDKDGGCSNVNAALPCTDGDACTSVDQCDAGSCVGGAAVNCNDGDPCTADGCDSEAGCTQTPNVAACEDGQNCTLGDSCEDGVCVGGTPLECVDGNPCTDESCLDAVGCVFTENEADCDDGSACTLDDACQGGSCKSGSSLQCGNNVFCDGQEACDPKVGCVDGSPLELDDGIACTVDSCDEDLDAILHEPHHAACDLGASCTAYTCDPDLGCQEAKIEICCGDGDQDEGEECDDGNLINGDGCSSDCKLPKVNSFSFTGDAQDWTVPDGVTVVQMKAWGAAGGGSDAEGKQYSGGAGGYATATLATTPGETLTVLVGEGGVMSLQEIKSAYPNGGKPGKRDGYSAGGGGGRCAVQRGNEEWVVAGGGGGAGGTGWGGPGPTTGGGGGGTSGGDGAWTTPGPDYSSCRGRGATQANGGAGGGGSCLGFSGLPGKKNQGGDGLPFPGPGNTGGGGGDGYYGGGSAALHAGGGGGSGYLHPDVLGGTLQAANGSNVPMTQDPHYEGGVAAPGAGVNGGHGYVVFIY